jgi:hypothetical protein
MLYIDSDNPHCVEDDSVTVSLEFPWETDTTYRCVRCGDGVVETVSGYKTESGCSTCIPDDEDSDDSTAHEVQRVPLSWANSASIDADEDGDSITVSISIGDPRGAFCFSVRRVPDDADSDLAGRLVLHVPYPGEPSPHEQLTALHPGAFVVG